MGLLAPGQGGSGTRGCPGLWSQLGRVSVPCLSKQPEVTCPLFHSLEFPELPVLGGEKGEERSGLGWFGPSSQLNKLLSFP